jgi:orotate phosphoribosyltransferase
VSAYQNQPIPALITRKQPKGHGTAAWIEGAELAPKTNVVVLEDVVTTGQSALFAVEKLRDAGYEVTHVLTLVDRLQGGAALYEKEGLQFASVFDITEIQNYASSSL